MDASPAVTGRIAELGDEQDPWTRARLAAADVLALCDVFDEAVATIWTLHAAQRGAADVARSLGVPKAMLLSAIARSQRVEREPRRP